jgi:hypothetical protein
MLDDIKYNVEGLTLPKGGCVRDQTFANDIALYLKGTKSNMDKMQLILNFICFTFEAKINWGKFVAIWANKNKWAWEWGQEVGLKWAPKSEKVRYLGIQVGFRLPMEANFNKLMISLKCRMIMRGNCNLSLACRILIANQVLLSSMWYMATYWNRNPIMCNQFRGVIRNFIWGRKAIKIQAKVKWDSFTHSSSSGG